MIKRSINLSVASPVNPAQRILRLARSHSGSSSKSFDLIPKPATAKLSFKPAAQLGRCRAGFGGPAQRMMAVRFGCASTDLLFMVCMISVLGSPRPPRTAGSKRAESLRLCALFPHSGSKTDHDSDMRYTECNCHKDRVPDRPDSCHN